MKLLDISTPKYPNTFAKVDDGDYWWLMEYTWCVSEQPRNLYAITGTRINGKTSTLRMHGVILGTREMVDHIDGNGLNNQRSNLRVCTNAENQRNRRKRAGGTSRFKGVYWFARDSVWVADIKIDGHSKYIGRFDCEGCAAVAYDNAAKEAFGEFACPNSYL